MPSIALVIPCLNEEKYLPKLLDCLVLQSQRPDEVIVADSKSDDNTLEIAKSFSAKLPIQTIQADRTPGAARNAGAKLASSEYLLFVDADIILPVDFIQKLKAYLDRNRTDFITPKFKSDGGHFVDSYLFWSCNLLIFIRVRLLRQLFGISGVMCIRRSLHEKVGFDDSRSVHEDLDYVLRLRKHKPTFAYLDKLVVTHSSRRYHNRSLMDVTFAFLSENTQLGYRFLQPALQKRGKGKKYGHFE